MFLREAGILFIQTRSLKPLTKGCKTQEPRPADPEEAPAEAQPDLKVAAVALEDEDALVQSRYR